MEAILDPLLNVLSSSQSPEDISNELLELLGYEEVELVMDVVQNRSIVVVEV